MYFIRSNHRMYDRRQFDSLIEAITFSNWAKRKHIIADVHRVLDSKCIYQAKYSVRPSQP